MIEAYRIGKPEDGQYEKPKKLKMFNLEGIPTVAVGPQEDLEIVIGNQNPDGSTSVIAIYLDDNHRETSILEYEMIKKLQFCNQKDSVEPKMQHIYNKNCGQCASGKGHVIRVDDIALGEPNFSKLRIVPWNILLKKVNIINSNGSVESRFEE